MNISVILLVVLTLARLWIALQLFLTARKSHLNNLYWLFGLFALAVYNLFTPVTNSPLANSPLFHFGFLAGHFCLAMFIHTTFYRNRKSPIYFVGGLIVLAILVDIYAFSTNKPDLVGMMTTVGLVNWVWHFFVARSAYQNIAADQSVEKWVKSRYQLMIAYVVMMFLGTIQVVISNSPLASSTPAIVVPITLFIVIVSVILQFLVWVMPEAFRMWLNRAEQVRPAHEEQHPRSVLDVFGDAMTTGTGLKTMVCFYAIRSAIGKEIGTEDSDVIRTRIKTMAYQDWEDILQSTELHRILVNGGADKADADQAVENARQALVDKQSLLTLSIR